MIERGGAYENIIFGKTVRAVFQTVYFYFDSGSFMCVADNGLRVGISDAGALYYQYRHAGYYLADR